LQASTQPGSVARRSSFERNSRAYAQLTGPLVRGRPADPEHLGGGRGQPALDQDPVDQKRSARLGGVPKPHKPEPAAEHVGVDGVALQG
jgi:hypothetical protein